MRIYRYCIWGLLLGFWGPSFAQILDHSWEYTVLQNEEKWYASSEAIRIAETVLLYQRDIGGWPKNIKPHAPHDENQIKSLISDKKSLYGSTIDNGATTLEMTFLARLNSQQANPKYQEAFLRGLHYLLAAQYANGGWPQFYPIKKDSYSRYITYNDDAMVNVLFLLKNIIDLRPPYNNIQFDKTTKDKVQIAFDKGIECILNTQYVQDGKLTAWCAQYDELTLRPAKARSYELPSLSGKESAGIVLLLMSIDTPSEQVIQAVKSAVYWFQEVKIPGLKQVRLYDKHGKPIDKIIVADSEAKPLWARFMDLDDNTPFFCDRDGVKKKSISEIGLERRLGYGWYVEDPSEVLSSYKEWLNNINKLKKKRKDLYEMVVAQNGDGDFEHIQEAIDHAKSFPYQRVIIRVKNGVYREKIHIPAWNPMISIIGESRDSTILRFGDFFDKMDRGRNSTFFTATLQVEGNDFYASELTIENNAGDVGQAIAIYINADRVKLENCIINGHQDTFYASGEGHRVFVKECSISGTTDFIFGEASVLFERCEIISLADSYITAASTPGGIPFGLVFLDCKLTAAKGVSRVYLGRPWRTYAKTVFINCHMDDHIIENGWHNWGNEEAENLTFYGEYKSTGPGANIKKRVSWSHQLTQEEAASYTENNILGRLHKVQSNEWYEYKMVK